MLPGNRTLQNLVRNVEEFLVILVTILLVESVNTLTIKNGEILYRKIMENFKLKEDEEYIELKNLIKLLGWLTLEVRLNFASITKRSK